MASKNMKRCSGTAAIRDAQNKATVRGSRTLSEASSSGGEDSRGRESKASRSRPRSGLQPGSLTAARRADGRAVRLLRSRVNLSPQLFWSEARGGEVPG